MASPLLNTKTAAPSPTDKTIKIRVSYGTAIVLGLIEARQDVAPTTAYLLFDRGCIGNCSFCSRANGNVRSKNLSRIIWPEFDLEVVLNRLTTPPLPFARICIQTGYNPAFEDELKQLVQRFIDTGIAVSSTLSPSQTALAKEMLASGLDHVGIGLDAATPETYARHKRKNWQQDWPDLVALLKQAGKQIEVHLIFGLGDSEECFCSRIQTVIDHGGKISLFALTPVNGGQPPEMSAYRRVQAFRYLCENHMLRYEECTFTNGKLTRLPMSDSELKTALNQGDAFRTSGCNKCNRPYYNERPGQPFFNYPRPLSHQEFAEAIEQMHLIVENQTAVDF